MRSRGVGEGPSGGRSGRSRGVPPTRGAVGDLGSLVLSGVGCGVGSWTVGHLAVAPASRQLRSRTARWATGQVGRCVRSVSEVADALGTG